MQCSCPLNLHRARPSPLAQIDSKGYLIPYSVTKDKNGNDKRRVKVGVSFDSEKRTLGEWKIVE